MQHKKSVLFLISLSQSKIQEIEEKGVNYELFLKIIQGYSHVELHETISEELISKASLYNIVVVIGHQVKGCIEMADGSLFPMSKIAQALPPQFNGYLHVAVCGSSSIREEIKRRCPDSRVRTSNNITQLELQLFIYSLLLSRTDLSKETFDDWYVFERGHIKELQKRKNPEDLAKLPCATKLGEPTTGPIPSVYSPEYVIPGYKFKIQVFLNFDSEKGIVHDIAIGRDHETKLHLIPETLKGIQKGDEVEIKLSMQDAKGTPTNLIKVCGKDCSYSETITISDKFVKKEFDVIVCEEYLSDVFWVVVEFIKDGKSIIEPYDYKISIKQESTQKINNANLIDILLGRKNLSGSREMINSRTDVHPEIQDENNNDKENKHNQSTCDDSIFRKEIDIEKVKQKLPEFVSLKVTGIKRWFVIYIVLFEIDFLADTKATRFIKWVEEVWGWKWSTKDFKSVAQGFKHTLSTQWPPKFNPKDGIKTINEETGKAYKKLADDIRREFAIVENDEVKRYNHYYFIDPENGYIEPKKLIKRL